MKAYRRTTVVLDDDVFQRLKEYSAESGQNIRQIISEAIEAKILKELDAKHKRSSQSTTFERNRFAQRLLVEVGKFLTPKTAEIIIIQKCEKYKVQLKKLSKNTITPQFIRDICKSVGYVTGEETATHLEEVLLQMIKDDVGVSKDVSGHD